MNFSGPPSFPGALPPPPGVIPNLVDPYSRASTVIIVNAVFLTIGTLFLVMRIYTRAFLSRALGADDCKSNIQTLAWIVLTVI